MKQEHTVRPTSFPRQGPILTRPDLTQRLTSFLRHCWHHLAQYRRRTLISSPTRPTTRATR